MTTLTPSEQSAPDPIEYIESEMLRRRLKRSDLEHAFGSRSKTAEVLNRKRGISLAMIRRLVFNHGFNAEKLIGGDYDFRNQKTDDALSKLEAGTHVLVPVERHRDAERYQWLRNRDLDTISTGGVFAGSTPSNVILNEDDLDQAIDAALLQASQEDG